MKDIETLLESQAAPKPHRELQAGFTQSVVAELRANPQPTKSSFYERISMKFHKPALALASAIAALTLFGGTAYATDGFTQMPSFLNAIFTSETQLPNGDRVVVLDTKECRAIEADGTVSQPKSSTQYFRLTKASTLTTTELLQLVQGNCESNNLSETLRQTYAELEELNTANKNALYSTADMTIRSVSQDALTAAGSTLVQVSNEAATHKEYEITFNHIAPEVLVDKHGKRTSWKSLAVGDKVWMVLRTTNPQPTITIDEPWLYDAEQTVVYVRQDDGNTEKAAEYIGQYGKTFEQVKPCGTSDDTKFCPLVSVAPDENIVRQAYTEYVKSYRNDMLGASQAKQKFMAHTDERLAADIFQTTAFDRITCAQNFPAIVTLGEPKKNGTFTTTPVNIQYADDSTQTITAIYNTETKKITAINCPPTR